MTLDRVIVQEIEYPGFMTKALLDEWLDMLPIAGPDDPNHPEWNATPVYELDLTPFGYNAVVYVKDESDKRSNQTGTLKDRRSWELGPIWYRAYADNLWRARLNGSLRRTSMPRLDDLTAGNAGTAEAVINEIYNLPPPKLLLDIRTPEERLEKLKKLRADIYLADLSTNIFTGNRESYTPKQIRILTNNKNGHDITSSRIVDPHKQYYDWHGHEAFNENPDEIYVPFGSGELFDNYITWQRETALNGERKKDVRLRVNPEDVARMSILAAEPRRVMTSKADKLTGQKPFRYYSENDLQGMRAFSFTGKDTGIYSVPEEKIKLAYEIMSRHFNCEVSAAAGLALYLQRYETGKIDPAKKALIINTGKGV